jgi:hypothetical protein
MPNRILLSEIGGERLLVCCSKCGLVSNLSVNVLMGSYGDLPLGALKAELARKRSCANGDKINSECEAFLQITTVTYARNISAEQPLLAGATAC